MAQGCAQLVRRMDCHSCNAVFLRFKVDKVGSLKLFAGHAMKTKTSFLALGINFPKRVLVSKLTASLRYHWQAKPHVLFRGKSSELGASTATGTAWPGFWALPYGKASWKSKIIKNIKTTGELQITRHRSGHVLNKVLYCQCLSLFLINMLLKQHSICFNECFALALRVCLFTHSIEYAELSSHNLGAPPFPTWEFSHEFLASAYKNEAIPSLCPTGLNLFLNKNQEDSQPTAL